MMQSTHQILEKYWGYKSYRPLQEEIINSVLQGNDTLALMPTGGGKSICFQVPALLQEGVCIVVSPLIALMKDQVDALREKGIKAIAITSEMQKRQIDIALDNCVHGDVKFLYLSPERLETEIVQVRIQRMKVNLIAIDEAHCISQWGYDFRPSYLKIQQLRVLIPNTPILALTATATNLVVNDIQKQLGCAKSNVLKKSFERENLSYVVVYDEDKYARLLKIANSVKGSGIIYARNRKRTQEISSYLISNNISADFYHAGLSAEQKIARHNAWMQNKTRVIVCTNAFGMGIDKPDVSFVAHADVPDSIEAYFQEAGRAGRNNSNAYAILLYHPADEVELKNNLFNRFPDEGTIRMVYQSLANFFQLATGAGKGITFSLDLSLFCTTYNLEAIIAYNSLKCIEREGYITFTDAYYQAPKAKIELSREDLYKFQLATPQYDAFIKTLLRMHAGLFDNFVKINEYDIARHLHLKHEDVVKKLEFLNQNEVISYVPQSELPLITFELERVDAQRLMLSKENYLLQKKYATERVEAIVHYASSSVRCRSQMLLGYFGEKDTKRCEKCDVCIEEKNKTLHTDEFEKIREQIISLLSVKNLHLEELVDNLTEGNEEKRIKTIRWMLDKDQLQYNMNNELVYSKK